jgi:hypothetical protein
MWICDCNFREQDRPRGVLFLLPGRNAAQPKLILADDSVIRSQIMTKDPALSTRSAHYPPRAIIVCR